MEEQNKQKQLVNGEVTEGVAAIEDKPAEEATEKPTKTKSKKEKKRD